MNTDRPLPHYVEDDPDPTEPHIQLTFGSDEYELDLPLEVPGPEELKPGR